MIFTLVSLLFHFAFADNGDLAQDLNLSRLPKNNQVRLLTSDGNPIKFGQSIDLETVANDEKLLIKATDIESSGFYALVAVDPDAPSRLNPKFRSWLHWLKLNIPAADLMSGIATNDGDSFVRYNPPNPPKGSGPHRYVFILLHQKEKIDENAVKNAERPKFDITTNLLNEAQGSFEEDPVDHTFFLTENMN